MKHHRAKLHAILLCLYLSACSNVGSDSDDPNTDSMAKGDAAMFGDARSDGDRVLDASDLQIDGAPRPIAVAPAGDVAQQDATTAAPDASGGIQFCRYATGCLDFVKHYPECAESNRTNCRNIYKGTYGEGACGDGYTRQRSDQTACGETITYKL
jgi:hypothetical protein